jgi:hypothetical protein
MIAKKKKDPKKSNTGSKDAKKIPLSDKDLGRVSGGAGPRPPPPKGKNVAS